MAVHAEQRAHIQHRSTGASPLFKSLVSVLLTFTAAVAFAIALAASAVVGYGLYYQDQVYPGVQAVGVDIGGISAAEAEAVLDQRTEAYKGSEIAFVYEDRTYVAHPADLGVEFDNARTVENAYEFGRSGSWWSDSWDWLDSLLFGRDVGVHATVDEQAFEGFLRSIAPDITVGARAPQFQMNSAGELELLSASEGLSINAGPTLRDLRSELSELGNGPVNIATTTVEPEYDESALEPVQEQLSAILDGPFVMEKNGYRWEISPTQLDSMLTVSVNPDTDEPSLRFDSERLHRHIAAVAEDASADGRDARVRWNGESYEAVPAIDGWVIDVNESAAIVERAILGGERQVELASTSQPAGITTEVAEEAASFGNRLADSRFQLTWDGGETDIGGSVIAAAMTFTNDDQNGEIAPEIDVQDLALFLTSIKGDVEVEPVDADLRYYDGEIEVVRQEEMGLEMDRDASAQSIADAVLAGELSAEIVVNDAEPEVLAAMADEIEIREMLSYGETYYGNSAENRAHNVELATELANGALVPPGGTYSFVDSIGGEISEDVGYEQGFGIVGATDGGVSTVPSVGGGVCQVSTTVFQAAFWAGLEIGERNWHLYWMPLYGQDPSGMTGLDATVDTSAGLDFTFVNNTDDWVAIVATADGHANRFEIWGTDPGWEIETEGPNISNRVSADSGMVYEETDRLPAGTQNQVETAHDGFDVEIKRWVYDSNGDEIDDLVLQSRYRPASNRTLIGTGG